MATHDGWHTYLAVVSVLSFEHTCIDICSRDLLLFLQELCNRSTLSTSSFDKGQRRGYDHTLRASALDYKSRSIRQRLDPVRWLLAKPPIHDSWVD